MSWRTELKAWKQRREDQKAAKLRAQLKQKCQRYTVLDVVVKCRYCPGMIYTREFAEQNWDFIKGYAPCQHYMINKEDNGG